MPESNDHSAMAAAVMAVCMILVVETVELEFLESPVLCRIGLLVNLSFVGGFGEESKNLLARADCSWRL